MTAEIFLATRDADIESCYAAFQALRPHIAQAEFLPQVRRQQVQAYQILALRHEGRVHSAAGFRVAEFLAWGKILYIDDLTTLPDARSRGYAGQLLDRLITMARSEGCRAVHLDSGYARHDAHRLYLRHGFHLTSHHFSYAL